MLECDRLNCTPRITGSTTPLLNNMFYLLTKASHGPVGPHLKSCDVGQHAIVGDIFAQVVACPWVFGTISMVNKECLKPMVFFFSCGCMSGLNHNKTTDVFGMCMTVCVALTPV